ncbi:MAG: nucleotidyltransferase family protein [Candidatus Diapherotrites archaeon]|nr:nucleotidyltransferase family protein [Candidatus Diapherotrites archaeon]
MMGSTKIVILCGGKGVRLMPLTKEIPKPLVELKNKPVLQYLMQLCASQGFDDFIVCTGYKAKLIESSVKNFSRKKWKVKFVNSGPAASMLERIMDASKFCGERFVVCYGDTVADVDLNKLVALHKRKKALITNVLYQMASPFGLMETKGAKVTCFKEKPLLPFWFNIGFYVFEKKVLKGANRFEWIPFLDMVVSSGKMFAHKHRGEHITFNTEHEKKEAESKIKVFSYVFG